MADEPQLPVPFVPLTPQRMAQLARELATNMRDIDAVLADFKITEEQFLVYSENPAFKNALESAIIDWNSAHSVEQRIRLQAAHGLEDGMQILVARMQKQSEPLTAAVETGKFLAKLVGIGEEGRNPGNPGDKFSIVINLGDDRKLHFSKDVTPGIEGSTCPAPNINENGEQGEKPELAALENHAVK